MILLWVTRDNPKGLPTTPSHAWTTGEFIIQVKADKTVGIQKETKQTDVTKKEDQMDERNSWRNHAEKFHSWIVGPGSI